MRDKRISPANATKLSKIIDMVGRDKEALIQLFKADIPFVSQGAVTKLITKHNMKGAEINKLKEEFNVESVQEGLDNADASVVKKVVKKLKGASDAHAGQAKDLEKAMDEGKVSKKERDRLEDQNQHGELALKLAKAYGTPAEVKKIEAINKRHKQKGSIEQKDQQERDKISNKYYKMAEQVELDEAKLNIKKIHKAVDDGKSMDVIVGMFADKRTTNTDEIRKIVKDYKFKKRMKEEVELEEGRMKELHMLIQQGKSAKEIAKIMKLDVKTIKSLMNSYVPEHANSKPHHHPHREADKYEDDDLKEKKKKPVVFKGTPKQIKQQMKNLKKKDKIKIGEGDAEDRVRDKHKDQTMRDRDTKEREVERAKVQDFRSAQRDKKAERERKQRNEVLDRVASKLKERTNG